MDRIAIGDAHLRARSLSIGSRILGDRNTRYHQQNCDSKAPGDALHPCGGGLLIGGPRKPAYVHHNKASLE
jgi:hypothetical protein